jgi:hypothetical protein
MGEGVKCGEVWLGRALTPTSRLSQGGEPAPVSADPLGYPEQRRVPEPMGRRSGERGLEHGAQVEKGFPER